MADMTLMLNDEEFRIRRREPAWVGLAVGLQGVIAAVAVTPPADLGLLGALPTLVTASWVTPRYAAGDLGRWLGERQATGGIRALIVEEGPWLSDLGPGGALLWGTLGLLVGLGGGQGLVFAPPTAAEDWLPEAARLLPDATPLQQRALAQVLAPQVRLW